MSRRRAQDDGLYPISAHTRIDRALHLLRTLPARELFDALWPGGVLLALTLALYFVERVEGVRSLRPAFAVAFTAAFIARCVVLSRWAGRRVQALLAAQNVVAVHGGTQAIMRAAVWVGFDLWLWLWLLVLAIYLEPWLVILVLPSFCLRAALLPSFLASADGSTHETGFGVLRAAVEESDGQRMAGVFAELLLLLGGLGLTFNLAALLAAVIGLGQDMLGLDLAFVSAFLSPRNYFALLAVGGLSLVCMEPVRATLSALLYVDTRLSRDGLALRVLVDRCAAEGRVRASRMILALILSLTCVPLAHGQEDASSEWAPQRCDDRCERTRATDAQVNARIDGILKQSVFTEFPDQRWSSSDRGLSSLFERFARWLAELSREEQARPQQKPWLNLPGSTFFIAVALLIAGLAALVLANNRKVPAETAATPVAKEDPFARSADEHLTDARSLRNADLTLALRSLYLATLVGLARRGHLTLSPERTNGQYLRALSGRDERTLFAALTRMFDRVHYGNLSPSQDDFDRCLTLAEQLVGKASV